MNAANWFWIIYVVFALFGIWRGVPGGRLVGTVVLVLVGLIGWQVFGPPLR